MVLELHAARQPRADPPLLGRDVLFPVHPAKLERRERLRHERRGGEGHLGPRPAQLPPEARHAAREIDQRVHVLVGLGREPDHEVELDEVPAGLEGEARGAEDLLLVEVLVDHVPQPLRAGFGGHREAGLAHPLDLRRQLLAERRGVQRGEPDRDAARRHLVHQRRQQREHRAVLAGVERGEGELVVAGRGDRGPHPLPHGGGVPLARRPVEVARLAETAAGRAAAHDLPRHAVVDDLGVRHEDRRRERMGVEVEDDAPLHAGRDVLPRLRARQQEAGPLVARDVVEPRRVPTLEAREAPHDLRARRSGVLEAPQFRQRLGERLLAVAEQDQVEERRERLGVRGRGAAGEHERRALFPLRGEKRDPAELEHREDVRRRQLVLQREADDVERRERRAALQRRQRQALRAQQPEHVAPGHERPLGGDAVEVVEQRVEDPEAEVGHPDFVEVGERERDAQPDVLGGLDALIDFAAEIARRLLDPRQQSLQRRRQFTVVREPSGHCVPVPRRAAEAPRRPALQR